MLTWTANGEPEWVALWEVTGEEVAGDGGGVVRFYAVTSHVGDLPDIHSAYRAVRGREGATLYRIDSVKLVESMGPFTTGLLIGDVVHDQRWRAVPPLELGLRGAPAPRYARTRRGQRETDAR